MSTFTPATTAVVMVLANHNVIEYYTSLPVVGKRWRVTSPYGNRLDPWGSGKTFFHPGTDFGDRPGGDPIRAPFPGIVTASAAQVSGGKYVGAGNYVAVRIDGTAIIMLFFHLQSRAVKVGQRVKVGDIVGYNGKTGNATGDHLHFELRKAEGSPTGNGVWGDPARFRLTVDLLAKVKIAVGDNKEVEQLKAQIESLRGERSNLAAELGIAGGKIADAVKVLTR